MTKSKTQQFQEQLDKEIKRAVAKAIEKHRQLGQSITFEKEGKIITLTADKIPQINLEEID